MGLLNSAKVNFLFVQGLVKGRRGGAPSGCRSSYGNGSWGKWREIGAGGTGSRPPRVKGWQRSSLQSARAVPRNGPCVAMATEAYSEQVGRNLQPWPGEIEWIAGESQRR